MRLEFASTLVRHHFGDLDAILFSHLQQGRFYRGIVKIAERYGQPAIVERNGGLRIQLERLEDVQTLYAVVRGGEAEELVGVIVYTRSTDGVLEILHCAVKGEYAMRGPKGNLEVMSRLMEELRGIG